MHQFLKRLGFALVPALAIAVIAILATEVALRIRFDAPESLSGITEWQNAQWGSLTYNWDTYHPRLGWTNLPGYRSGPRIPFEVTINSKGLRALREYTPGPSPGRKRILIFGDSSVFGEEVDDDQTLSVHLEPLKKKSFLSWARI